MLLPNTSSPELPRQTRPPAAHWPQAEGGVGALRTDHLERESPELFLPGKWGWRWVSPNHPSLWPLACQETNTWSLIADPWRTSLHHHSFLQPGLALFLSNVRIPFPLTKHLVGFIVRKALNTEIRLGRNDRCSYGIFSFKSRFHYNAKYAFLTSLQFTTEIRLMGKAALGPTT